ncbi:hypothetical protein AWM75_04945 [Aerococcus urinaehominis]|uniref:Uncharacterized protein n=1 Tax=Aerococcus urinaehominis TaxID=128944 RepID=A0A0X8FL86_9LACT|nr:hypothetical protein [Aerococcus urinaehominis]AMB99377.1 hypothetical protein AWM75_04945 [Aerococcus urinaehominis]SDM22998.1 hypothetical protein SAMN04487985_10933 [Aerococcus urinaehominis]
MSKNRILVSLLIGGLMAASLILVQQVFPSPTFQAIFPTSPLLKSPWFIPLSGFLYTLFFSLISYGYDLVDLRLPGSSQFKAGLYVACTGLIWLVYVSEPLPHIQGADWLLNPLRLVFIFTIQYLLIKNWLARPKGAYRPKPLLYLRGLWVFIVTVVVFRYIAYMAFGVYAMPNQALYTNIIWSFSLGLAVGLVFTILQRFLRRQDRSGKVKQFTSFFAVNCLGYHLAYFLHYQVDLLEFAVRIFLDILAVALASYIVVNFQIEHPSQDRPQHDH